MPARPSIVPLLVIAALVVVAGAGLGLYVNFALRPAHPAPVLTVAYGNNVTVSYIGLFGSGPQNGRVFDTSLAAVAGNDASWPKSLEYAPRTSLSSYTPLAVHVGITPNSGYSLDNKTFIGVVTGFWEGLLGLPGNETHAINVPPTLGYGFSNPACEVQVPLVQSLPVVETMNRSAFSNEFRGTAPVTGLSFLDPVFGWTVYVLSVNATSVTLENAASVGDSGSPSGWEEVVTNVSAPTNGTGSIRIANELSPAEAGLVAGTSTSGGPTGCSGSKFIVSAVDPIAGTFTEDFNSEVTGETLIFIVSVVDILP
jgi:hypothetical protein